MHIFSLNLIVVTNTQVSTQMKLGWKGYGTLLVRLSKDDKQ